MLVRFSPICFFLLRNTFGTSDRKQDRRQGNSEEIIIPFSQSFISPSFTCRYRVREGDENWSGVIVIPVLTDSKDQPYFYICKQEAGKHSGVWKPVHHRTLYTHIHTLDSAHASRGERNPVDAGRTWALDHTGNTYLSVNPLPQNN